MLTNNYMMRTQVERIVQSGRLSYCCTENNLALLVEQAAWQRVYYYLNDLIEPLLLSEFPPLKKFSKNSQDAW